jgi:WD40 repeat protein
VAKGGYVNQLAFSPDSGQLATAEGDVNATQDGQGSARIAIAGGQAQTSAVDKVAAEPDGQGETPQQRPADIIGVRLWDVATGENRLYLPHKKPVENILFSPDGRRIATDMFLKRQDAVQLWDATTGERIASMQASPQGSGIGVKVFSPNGKYLAAKTGNEVLIWEVESGQEVKRLLHANGVGDVVFSASGRYLAAANEDKISIWDWSQGREIARLSHDDEITAIAFTPDDRRIISASQDKTVRVWAWQADDLITDACARLEHNLTREEWRTFLGDEPYDKGTCPHLPVPEK